MILYVKSSNNATIKLLELINSVILQDTKSTKKMSCMLNTNIKLYEEKI